MQKQLYSLMGLLMTNQQNACLSIVRGLGKINKRLLTWKEENHFVELSILSRFLQHAVTTSFSKEANDE